jgi:hypothetical protein
MARPHNNLLPWLAGQVKSLLLMVLWILSNLIQGLSRLTCAEHLPSFESGFESRRFLP